MKRTVLITGANGFVGRALCRRLQNETWKVRGSVRPGKRIPSRSGEIDTVTIGSIDAHTDWSAAISGVNTVVHLAARVHVMHDDATDSLAEFRRVNVSGTRCLARTAAASDVKRFVYLSSVKVNGEGRALPYTENDTPEPGDAYGKSKWEAEQTLRTIARETGMEVTVLRAPLAYGPHVKANFLTLTTAIYRGLPLPFSRVENRRSMVFLGNLIDAVVACMIHPHAAGQTYLVSDGKDISTPELIRSLGIALGRPARLFPVPPALLKRGAQVFGKSSTLKRLLDSLTVDISKIRQELNWRAPYTMAQGLEETARWYLNRASERIPRGLS